MKMVNYYIKSQNPVLNIVQNEVMKTVLNDNSKNDMYVKLDVSAKVPYYNAEVDSSYRYEPITFDFFDYNHDEYLYSVSFPTHWINDLRMVGPVNMMTYNLLSLFIEYWAKTDHSVIVKEEDKIDRSINAHFYLRSDDPNIVAFLSEFYTDLDKYFMLGKSYTMHSPEGYYYFICSEVIDSFSYWYVVFTKELPRIYRK